MLKKYLLLSLLSTLALTACSSMSNNDDKPFTQARPLMAPATATETTSQIIKIPKSQLLHTSSSQRNTKISGKKVVQSANKRSLIKPTPADAANSTIIFPYAPGNIYEIYTTPLNITDIALQPGEQVISFGAGDTSRWQISRTASGSGSDRVEHLVIKPLMENLNTSMIITSNLRTYHLLLQSTKDTFMAAVQWQYADQGSLTNNTASDDSTPTIPTTNSSGLAIPQLDFGYQLRVTHGDQPDWYPSAVFNDGVKTYIEFPQHIQSAPALFVKDSDSGDAAVNYRIANNYYIVDQVFTAAELMTNNGETVVTINHKK